MPLLCRRSQYLRPYSRELLFRLLVHRILHSCCRSPPFYPALTCKPTPAPVLPADPPRPHFDILGVLSVRVACLSPSHALELNRPPPLLYHCKTPSLSSYPITPILHRLPPVAQRHQSTAATYAIGSKVVVDLLLAEALLVDGSTPVKKDVQRALSGLHYTALIALERSLKRTHKVWNASLEWPRVGIGYELRAFEAKLQKLTQTTPDQPVDDEAVYYKVAGECPKGRVYGLGSLGRKKRRYADVDASTSQQKLQNGLALLRDACCHVPLTMKLSLCYSSATLHSVKSKIDEPKDRGTCCFLPYKAYKESNFTAVWNEEPFSKASKNLST
ncbi:hypothetical protein Syun_031681 [Stephania yunnanensis]|uniref:Uncharacterized protein n=1 Tax=Stephania yunnanensis TaxID=152371 RepID=A0AAP0E2P1_9MAGN